MKLLLDTHVLIWALVSPEKLGEKATDALTAEGNEVFASHVSIWEIAIKRQAGKIDGIDRAAIDWFETYVPKSRMRQLPISAKHLGAVEFLPKHHRDPFDRLLVAQARSEQLTLVTSDDLVRQYEIDWIW